MLLQRLARGGMGEIYLGQKAKSTNKHYVALKTLRPDLTLDEEYVTRFLDEARVAIILNHPCINRVFDVGFAEGTYFLELEYISGRDIRALLERARDLERKVPRRLAFYLIGELLSALAYLHEAKDLSGQNLNLIHRDVSPQNIMVSWKGGVTLIDFGLARFAARTTATEPGMVMGKLRYMAPEQARGGNIDHRVDLFAAGVVLYEMLSGRRLYENTESTDLWGIVARGQALEGVSFDEVPEDTIPIIQRSLAADPAKRYPDAKFFLADLRRIADPPSTSMQTETEALLNDLFEVDLKVEREFMQELGRVAPFDLSPQEFTHSVSLADPAASLPEETASAPKVSVVPPSDPVATPGPTAAPKRVTPSSAKVTVVPPNADTSDDTGPLASEVADPVFAHSPQEKTGKEQPAAAAQAPAASEERTYVVDRTGEVNTVVAASDEVTSKEDLSGNESTELNPKMDNSLSTTNALVDEETQPTGHLHPLMALASQLSKPQYMASIVGFVALILIVAIIVVISSGTGGDATATADPVANHKMTVRTPEIEQPVDAGAAPEPVDAAPHREPKNQEPVQQIDRPEKIDKPQPKDPDPKTLKPQESKEDLIQRQHQRERDEEIKRRKANALATRRALEQARNALTRKGLDLEDAYRLWPQSRKLKDTKLSQKERTRILEQLFADLRTFTFTKLFVRSKLNAVQNSYNRLRPRLDETTAIFRRLELQRADMLKAYSHAKDDPQKLAHVNHLINKLAISLRMASR